MHRMVGCRTGLQFLYEMEEHKNWETLMSSSEFGIL